jgi:eukaryotic-like serine/threonine-protein kinase
MIFAGMSLRDRIRALLRIFLLVTVLVAAGLVSMITTIRLAIRGHQATVPSLVGVAADTAQRLLSDRGLTLQVEDKVYSSQYAANQIVSQVPSEGTHMKAGQHVHVLVSLGPQEVNVPDLVGSSLRAARIMAVQRGLGVGDVATVYSPGTDPNQVLAQDPLPQSSTVRSPAVDFLVSLGAPAPAYECPNFRGRSVAQVRQQLEAAGFQVGQVISLPSISAAPGTIVAQTPPAGSRITPNTAFNFQVSTEGEASPSNP